MWRCKFLDFVKVKVYWFELSGLWFWEPEENWIDVFIIIVLLLVKSVEN